MSIKVYIMNQTSEVPITTAIEKSEYFSYDSHEMPNFVFCYAYYLFLCYFAYFSFFFCCIVPIRTFSCLDEMFVIYFFSVL